MLYYFFFPLPLIRSLKDSHKKQKKIEVSYLQRIILPFHTNPFLILQSQDMRFSPSFNGVRGTISVNSEFH